MKDDTPMPSGLFENGHLTPMALASLRQGRLEGAQQDAALLHLGRCEPCAAAYAGGFGERELCDPPAGFGETLARRRARAAADRRAFVGYAFRVALAACVALVVTFSGAFGQWAAWQEKAGDVRAPSFRTVDRLSAGLRDFSQTILDLEVFHNAPKKK